MGKFTFEETFIKDLFVITPTVFGDNRGYFLETYQKEEFAAAGITAEFVQDNESCSAKGVLRGLHFQKQNPQGKLVRVISGEVYDVAVDLRGDSETYGNGTVCASPQKIKSSSTSPRASHTVFWCSRTPLPSCINVRVCIAPPMRAVSLMMTPLLLSIGL